MNFLEETKNAIKENKHKPQDIKFIGSLISGHSCTWDEFCSLANKQYDNGFGTHYVPLDLVILFKDSSALHRQEYDGSEYWDFLPALDLDIEKLPIKKLIGYSPDSLASLQNENEEE